jgi:hypothetical protein
MIVNIPMSRLIESRENFLWSLDSSSEKNNSIVAYIPGLCCSNLGMVCPHLACDVVILSPEDWKIFKKYALKEFARLEKTGICIKEASVRGMKPTLFKYLSGLDNHNVYSYFASIADTLTQKLKRSYNPIIQSTIRGRIIPENDHRRLWKLYSAPITNPVKYFISYAKLWKSITDDIAVREEFENNIEVYIPEVSNLPDELIDYIKEFLF